jgi:hypothetical protein
MDIQGVKIDPAKVEAGDWVGSIPQMGDLRLRVRGVNNSDWRKIQSRMLDAVPRNKRSGNRIDPAEQDKIMTALLRDAGLVDWENLMDSGAAVPYSKEAADKYLTDPAWSPFRDAVLWACTEVGHDRAKALDDDLKN